MHIIAIADFANVTWNIKPEGDGVGLFIATSGGEQTAAVQLTVTEARALATRLRQVAADVAGQAVE